MSMNASQVIAQHTSYTLDNIETIYQQLRDADAAPSQTYSLSHVSEIDTAGAQVLLSFALSTEATYSNSSSAVTTFIISTGLNTHFPFAVNEA